MLSPHRLLTGRVEPGQALPLAALLMTTLLLVIGLAIDAGQLLLARRALQSSADAAAFAGAQQLDLVALRANRELRLDTAAATSAAYAMLAAEGVGEAEVSASPTQVDVIVRATVRPTLMRLSPAVGEVITLEAVASAAPRSR